MKKTESQSTTRLPGRGGLPSLIIATVPRVGIHLIHESHCPQTCYQSLSL